MPTHLRTPAPAAPPPPKHLHLIAQGEAFYKKTFLACQHVATPCAALLPLFVTNTPSHGAAARKVYHDRAFALRSVAKFDVDHQDCDPEWAWGGMLSTTSFRFNSSTPSPLRCPSSALGRGCSSTRAWPTWREAWIARVRNPFARLRHPKTQSIAVSELPPPSCLAL
jgi:hypothetical protein